MRVANHPDQEMIHATLWLDMSDLPAARKSGGFKSHSSTEFMCTFCTQSFYSLVTPDAFIPESKSLLRMGNLGVGWVSRCHEFYCCLDFVLRNDWRYLKYAFLHARASAESNTELAQEIFDRKGIQFSPLYKLPGFMPSASAPPDYMHGMYLGTILLVRRHDFILIQHAIAIIRHTVNQILVVGGILSRRSDGINALVRFEECLSKIWWPSNVDRVPKKVDVASFELYLPTRSN